MSNQLEKLKHSIKKEYVNNFELNLMKSSGFIPVDKRQSDFFVILNKENSAGRAEIIQLIKEKYQNLTPQFIPISGRDFDEVFNSITTVTLPKVEEQPAEPKPAEELSAEEILVSIGWLTREQLNECTALAKERNVPLDMILTEKEYLPFDRIASYLKKKYGCDVVSKAQIKVDKSMLKMLPDDIVEKKQIVVMSMEGSKLGVAMVNPNDKFTIREVSLSTGRALNVYCIPYAEYDKYLKEYFIQKKSDQTVKETERIIQSMLMKNLSGLRLKKNCRMPAVT